jgi:hypothetical protein
MTLSVRGTTAKRSYVDVTAEALAMVWVWAGSEAATDRRDSWRTASRGAH